jgi:uncharacterized protein (TIGR03437 family)
MTHHFYEGSLFSILGLYLLGSAQLAGQATNISGPAYKEIKGRVLLNEQMFSVYLYGDSGYNHGFFSDLPNGQYATLNPFCVDETASATGCASATDPNALDLARGTVLSVTLAPPTGYSALSIQEPQVAMCISPQLLPGCGYDLSPPSSAATAASTISFEARSPDEGSFLFGVGPPFGTLNGACVTAQAIPIPPSWTTIVVNLNNLVVPGTASVPCQPQITDLNILFEVQAVSPNQGTILLDKIVFNPTPARQQSIASLPLSTQTFGANPLPAPDLTDRSLWPFPPDQVNVNAASTYESSLALLALLAPGAGQDLTNAQIVAEALDSALYNDNHGDPIPTSPTGLQACYRGAPGLTQCGLHDDYESGDLTLNSTQPPPEEGQAGDIRLAGFSLPPMENGSQSNLCGPSHFCLINDGASGGNNAYAMLALLAAYQAFSNTKYLNDAIAIGNWIAANLQDNTGFKGYFTGYQTCSTSACSDFVTPLNPTKYLSHSKSTENNADIFAVFSELAAVQNQLGNPAAAKYWTNAAQIAADFVCSLWDETLGSFDAGTLAMSQQALWGTAGVSPEPARQLGDDVPNAFDFLDSDTFTTLALAGFNQCSSTFDWRRPIQHVLNTFLQPTLAVGNQTFQGFNLVAQPSDPNASGIAWEFTGQVVETMRYVDQLYGETNFANQVSLYLQQIAKAQTSDPFGDGQGLVASTLQNGATLPALDQCLATPYQCIPERVGLAATVWAIFAEQGINPEVPFPVVNSVTNAASASPGAIAPGEIVSIFGSGLGPISGVSFSVDTTTGLVDSNLAGTQVLFGSFAAPILYTSSGQINAIVPYEVTGQTQVPMQVQYNGAQSASMTLQVASATPGVFTLNSRGPGQAAAINQNGSLNGPSNPAAPGSYVTLYFTGGGQTNPPGVTGSVTGSVLKYFVQNVLATVGGQQAFVQFAGSAPKYVDGLGQLNIQLANNTPSGMQPLLIMMDGVASPATATLSVQ